MRTKITHFSGVTAPLRQDMANARLASYFGHRQGLVQRPSISMKSFLFALENKNEDNTKINSIESSANLSL